MPTLIAQRNVEIKRGEEMLAGSVQVFTPEYHPADENGSGFWQCNYKLNFEDEQREHNTKGVDAYQALQLALQMVPVQISATNTYRNGKLFLWGNQLQAINQTFGLKPLGDA